DRRIAVVEDLRQVCVQSLKCRHVGLKKPQRVEFVLGGIGSAFIFSFLGELQGFLSGFITAVQPIDNGLDGSNQFTLFRIWIQLDSGHAIDFKVVVVTGGVQLGAQIVNQVRICHVGELGSGVVSLERG